MMYNPLACLGFLILATAHAFSGDELTEMLKVGLGNVVKETINGAVTLEKGTIPKWLSGNFIRHACGAFGETDHRNKDLPNYIEHLFDCFEMGSKFSIDNGQVTFTNKWYDATVEDIYNSYGRQMNDSSMFVHSAFSKVNAKQIDKWNANMSSPSKVSEIPNVSWWLIGNQAIAMTEDPIGVVIDPNGVVQKGYMQYDDDNLGVPDTQQYLFSNNPAHEQTEPDGTLWSTVSVVKFETPSHLKIKRIVYKVGSDTVRHVVGTYNYEDSDITRCKGDNPYPDFGSRFGYLHSFAMTENYIILPETAYMDDPCVFSRYDQYKPFFTQGFRYEPNGYSRLLIMRKSDGEFVANITMPPFFATHQLGAYEDGNIIHMDMLTYNDSGIYDRHLFVDNLLTENPYTTNISRIEISLSAKSARMRSLRANGKPPSAFEMPNINYKYYGKKYTYAYLTRNFDRRDQNAITKSERIQDPMKFRITSNWSDFKKTFYTASADMMYNPLACLGFLILATAHAFSGDELTEMLKVGLGNVVKETINGAVTLEKGTIPKWLSGNFIRHACGAFGETDHRNKDLPNYIEHLFDCFEMGSKFSIDNGQVTFTNKWYDATVEDIYNSYGRQMNDSSMFVHSAFSKVNAKQIDKWNANMSSPSKVSEIPNVSWWLIGNQAIAMTEDPIGVVIDPNGVVQKGYMQYDDDNLGVPDTQQYLFSNNPAHEQTEPDGTLWSTVSVVKFETPSHLKIKRIVYKVGSDTVRHVVGTYNYEDSDITRCKGDNPYPDFGSRFGYLHSFAMTENYIILPETAYMDDPCVFSRYDQYKPFFTQGFRYEPNGYSRLLIMRKSDGEFVANITMPPFFATHQLGAYEDGNIIHMDMLTYNDSGIYDRHLFVDNLLTENPYTTNISRIEISLSAKSARMRSLRANGKPPSAFEMPNINYKYYGKKYTYAYLTRNFDRRDQNAITKLNVDTGIEVEFVLPEGMFVQEPQFVARPGAVFEDDGVILAQGVDGRKHKAFLLIVDARTMMLIGHVTAPDIALFGIHNRFFPLTVGRSTVDTSAGAVG